MIIEAEEMLALKEYQATTHSTAIYRDEYAMPYLALGLLAEVKEFVEAENPERAIDEIGDMMWFISELANLIDADLSLLLATENLNWSTPMATDVVGAALIADEFLAISGDLAKHLRDGSPYEQELNRFLWRAVQIVYSMVDIMEGATKVSFTDLLTSNRQKLLDRQARGVLGGSGDKR